MILKADTLSMETTLGAKMLVAVLLALFWVWVMKKVIAKQAPRQQKSPRFKNSPASSPICEPRRPR